MGAINNKLKSNSGATLMMALLFFVVCAVTGSMILLGATTTAGRLEGMKASDQNYYAVRSAAKFIEKQLSNEHIKVKEKLIIEETTVTTIEDEVPKEEVTTSYTYEKPVFYHVVNGSEQLINSDVRSEDNILLYLLTNSSITNYGEKTSESNSDTYPDAFSKDWFKSESDISDKAKEGITVSDTEISVKNGSEDISGLKVKMLSVNLKPSGELSIKLINDIQEDSAGLAMNEYSMVLKMQCNKTVTPHESTVTENISEDEKKETTTITREYDLTFTPIIIEKA